MLRNLYFLRSKTSVWRSTYDASLRCRGRRETKIIISTICAGATLPFVKNLHNMKTFFVAALLVLCPALGFSQDKVTEASQRVERESIEWCDIWIPSAASTTRVRVLLVGDSITRDYYNAVAEQVGENAACVRLATSACVADPAFCAQLKIILAHYQIDVVHFNNGLHGMGYTEKEYRDGYLKALKVITEMSPSASLILALSTPLQETSNRNHLNPRIDARNEIVRELAVSFSAETNDLHSISRGNPEYYRDPYHFKPIAVKLQAAQVTERIIGALEGRETTKKALGEQDAPANPNQR